MLNQIRIYHKFFTVMLALTLLGLLVACGTSTPPPTPTSPPLAKEIVFYNWDGDQVQSVMDAFTDEYGVTVTYAPYDSTEEALANIKAGEVYDLVVLDNNVLPEAIADGLLAEIDFRNIPNFKNILANFRDLRHDPGNKHSIPFTWGTTALIVRTDLEKPITRWSDLWNLQPDHKIALRDEARESLAWALKSLGYSINSEDPAELEATLERLLEIRENIIVVEEGSAEEAVPLLLNNEAAALVGWAEDALYAQEESDSFAYVYPEEGAILWGDSFIIPASSPNKETAELFLNFLMQPEINADIVNETYYATANEAARPFVDPDIRDDPLTFPPSEDLKKAEVLLPLSAETTELYNKTWERFKTADQ